MFHAPQKVFVPALKGLVQLVFEMFPILKLEGLYFRPRLCFSVSPFQEMSSYLCAASALRRWEVCVHVCWCVFNPTANTHTHTRFRHF